MADDNALQNAILAKSEEGNSSKNSLPCIKSDENSKQKDNIKL